VPCGLCRESLIVIYDKNGDLAGVRCPQGHVVYPLVNGVFPRESLQELQDMMRSVEAGKLIPCVVCGELLIPVYTEDGVNLVEVRCPQGHEVYPMLYT